MSAGSPESKASPAEDAAATKATPALSISPEKVCFKSHTGSVAEIASHVLGEGEGLGRRGGQAGRPRQRRRRSRPALRCPPDWNCERGADLGRVWRGRAQRGGCGDAASAGHQGPVRRKSAAVSCCGRVEQ